MTTTPAYKNIQTDILNQIAEGTLQPGDRIATESELMEKYGVSRITAQRAVSELKQKGVLTRKPRAGTFVARTLPAASDAVRVSGLISGEINIVVIAPFDLAQGGAGGAYQYIKGIMSAVTPGRDQLTLLSTGNDPDLERRMLESFMERRASGLIYHPGATSVRPKDILMRMVAYGTPCMQIDQRVSGVPIPCVHTDNISAGVELTRHALNCGHEKFCFLGDMVDSDSQYDRYQGMCQALAELGISQNNALYRRFDLNSAQSASLVEWLFQKKITCVCCATDVISKPLLDLFESAGIREEISIISFDGSYPGKIASMQQDFVQIGRTATEMLLEWLQTGRKPTADCLIKATYIDGESLRRR